MLQILNTKVYSRELVFFNVTYHCQKLIQPYFSCSVTLMILQMLLLFLGFWIKKSCWQTFQAFYGTESGEIVCLKLWCRIKELLTAILCSYFLFSFKRWCWTNKNSKMLEKSSILHSSYLLPENNLVIIRD